MSTVLLYALGFAHLLAIVGLIALAFAAWDDAPPLSVGLVILACLLFGLFSLYPSEDAEANSDGSHSCGKTTTGFTVEAGAKTTCPFARVIVRRTQSYQRAVGSVSDGDRFTHHGVRSPVTGKRYRVRCSVDLGRRAQFVYCSGKNGIRVTLYRVQS